MALAGQIVRYETLRSLAFGGISAAYAGVGASFTNPVRMLTIDNFTDANLLISFDGVINKTVIHSNSTKVMDYASNKIEPVGQLEQPIGDRVYVKQESGAAGSGSVYVTVVYASTT